jgi:hypothetical protein
MTKPRPGSGFDDEPEFQPVGQGVQNVDGSWMRDANGRLITRKVTPTTEERGSEMLTMKSALRIARDTQFPELEQALLVEKDAGADFVSVTPNDTMTDLTVQQPSGIMVAWMLPEEYGTTLTVEGGVTDHHVTLSYLGDVTALSADDQRRLIGVVAEVASRHEGVAGTIGGTGTFDNDDNLVWWAGVHIPDLGVIQEDLETALAGAGFTNASSYADEPWTPHVTLAYLPAGSEAPNIDVAPFEAVVDCLTVAIGGTRYDLPLQPINWQEQAPNTGETVRPDGGIEMPPRIVTPFVPSVLSKGKVRKDETGISVNPATGEEWRYTLGPVYIPGEMDAHGDSVDPDVLELAIHDYVKSGDRLIRMQHDIDTIAGEWVGLLVWPWEVDMPVTDPDTGEETVQHFPANTPFMGVEWTPDVWEDVKAGKIRGYSLGGIADFFTVDLYDDEGEPLTTLENAKYSADDRKAMAKKGQAMPDGSYPIGDKADLANAIKAVGRGGGSHNAIRAFIMRRARALGATGSIPINWKADGSLKE